MGRKIFAAVAILIGLVVLAYPHISSYLNDKNGSYVSQNYHKKAAGLDPALVEKMWQEAELYNQSLAGVSIGDPFSGSDAQTALPQNYYDTLKYDGKMATVQIPKIKVDLPIYHGTGEKVLQKAVGHLEGSALPIGGTDRHAVLTGHSGLSHAKIFTHLTELTEGDQFYIRVLGKTLAYEVDQIKVIEPHEVEHLQVQGGRDLVTLLTCTPYGVNSHRLLVRGTRVPYDPKKEAAIKPADTMSEEQKRLLMIAAITAGIMLLLIIATMIKNKIQAGKE